MTDNPQMPAEAGTAFLAHCAVSPLSAGTHRAAAETLAAQAQYGLRAFDHLPPILSALRRSGAELLRTSAENVCFVDSTALGISIIANGYPFAAGDEVITYRHEYPSNYYPWLLQARTRGVRLIELDDCDPLGGLPPGMPRGWSLEQLAQAITPRTRVVALSHVQFTSGFAADLPALGELCRGRGIDLVIDAAQSLGALPIFPDDHGISAVVSSGWKWLCGPVGAGLMYTSGEFRAKLGDILVGSDGMQQGRNYLDHSWQPFASSRRFEFSTLPLCCAAGLAQAIVERVAAGPAEVLREEIFKRHDYALSRLDRDRFRPLLFADKNRSGILSLLPQRKPEEIVEEAYRRRVVVTARDGYLRFAPHYFTPYSDIERAVEVLNAVG